MWKSKSFNIVMIIMLFIISSIKVNAKTYNYSCDYSFVPSTGETIKFRVRVKDLDEDYIKGKEASYWENADFWKQHVVFMPYKGGQYIPFTYTFGNSGITKDFDGQNKKGCKSLYTLNPSSDMSKFVEKSVDLDKNDIVCPKLNWYQDSINSSCVVSFSSSRSVECVSCNESGCEQPYGMDTCYKNVSNSTASVSGPNCYNESGAAVKCDSVTGGTGIYDKENEVVCTYSGNVANLPFRLIYNKKDETLLFNENNSGYTLDSSNSMMEKDGKYYLTDSELLSKFKNTAANNQCPSSITCDCGWEISTQISHLGEYRGTKCFFNVVGHSNSTCGNNQSQNGEKIDPSEKTGQKPSIKGSGFGTGSMKCSDILGTNLTKIVHAGIRAIQIIGAIVAIVNGMITLIPAVMSKDADGLKKAEKKLVLMAIILLCIFLLPYLARWIGSIFDYDISCII